jgi:hypothetical protein
MSIDIENSDRDVDGGVKVTKTSIASLDPDLEAVLRYSDVAMVG